MKPVFVINLDTSQKRLVRFQQEANRVNLEFERISAVAGSTLSKKEIENIYPSTQIRKHFRQALNAGELGCFLSHIKCWQKVVDDKLDYAMILEDDIGIHPDTQRFATEAGRHCQHWDLIQLNNRDTQDTKIHDTLRILDDYALTLQTKFSIGAVGYLVSYAGAQKLLQNAFPIKYPVDHYFRHWFSSGVRGFCVNTNFIYPLREEVSEIGYYLDKSIVLSPKIKRLWLRYKLSYNLWKHQHILWDAWSHITESVQQATNTPQTS
tara:strand:- start:10273 stop:11067 length:795 start_codon:yes stop_codon:yes gene_type:complete